MLKTKIQEELTDALKSGLADKVETLRFLMADIKNEEINSRQELSDDDVLNIVKKSVKKLADASVLFEKGGRPDLVQQNKQQIDILSVYLPAQLSDEELESEIKKIITENQDAYNANPKSIIGIAMKSLSSRADPQRIMKALS